MKTIRLILVALLLWASPAAAICELACSADAGPAQPSAGEASHDHHHDQNTSHHSQPDDESGCCCVSQSLASKEAELRILTHNADSIAAIPSATALVPPATIRPERGTISRYARPPFSDRARPLLI